MDTPKYVTLEGTLVATAETHKYKFYLKPENSENEDDCYWLIVPSAKQDLINKYRGQKVKVQSIWIGMDAGQPKFEVERMDRIA